MTQSLTCLPVTGTDLDSFLQNLEKAQQLNSKLIELRADYISDFKVIMLQKILEKLQKPAIFTFRKKRDGGKFGGEITDWVEIINFSLQLGFDYLDIEFPSVRMIDLTKKHPKTKIITSFHDFNQTPGYREMRKIQKRMRAFDPDFKKFACHVKTEQDLKNLIRLLVSSKKKENMIVIGMGNKGKISRIIGPILGSKINFLSWGKNGSALGQYDLTEFSKIQKYLEL